MSKQNGGEGGIIINMSSLAGKDNYHVTNDFLLVIGTTKVTLQSVFIINSGLKLKLGLLFFFFTGSMEFSVVYYQKFKL